MSAEAIVRAFPVPQTEGSDAAALLADLLELAAACEAGTLPLEQIRALTTGTSRYAAMHHALTGGATAEQKAMLGRLFDALVRTEHHRDLGWSFVSARHGVFTRAELEAPHLYDAHNARMGGRTPGQRG